MIDLLEKSDALLSPCGLYRYWLSRTWDEAKPHLVWCCLNPSTADDRMDDPTIRRIRGFTLREGYGGFIVVNLFAFRATDPEDVWRAGASMVGPDNDRHILDVIQGRRVVCGWGADPNARKRAREVAIMIRQNADAFCLGLTKHGAPKHPLFLASDTAMVPFVGVTTHDT